MAQLYTPREIPQIDPSFDDEDISPVELFEARLALTLWALTTSENEDD